MLVRPLHTWLRQIRARGIRPLLVADHPASSPGDSFCDDMTLRLVNEVSTFGVNQHQFTKEIASLPPCDFLKTPPTMCSARRQLNKRTLFTRYFLDPKPQSGRPTAWPVDIPTIEACSPSRSHWRIRTPQQASVARRTYHPPTRPGACKPRRSLPRNGPRATPASEASFQCRLLPNRAFPALHMSALDPGTLRGTHLPSRTPDAVHRDVVIPHILGPLPRRLTKMCHQRADCPPSSILSMVFLPTKSRRAILSWIARRIWQRCPAPHPAWRVSWHKCTTERPTGTVRPEETRRVPPSAQSRRSLPPTPGLAIVGSHRCTS